MLRSAAILALSAVAAISATPTKDEYCAAFAPLTDAQCDDDRMTKWVGELSDMFSPDDICPQSMRYVELDESSGVLHVSASGTDDGCNSTWGWKFDSDVDPTLAPTAVACNRTTSFISKIPPTDPLYDDAQAGALDFTLVLGSAFGQTVLKWNGVYNGHGGDINGEIQPPSDCDNFWLYQSSS